MRKLTTADVMRNEEYMKQREDRRKEIIAKKKFRRVGVGEQISFTFENHDTVLYQIQEMLRVERINDDEKIQQEVDVYNELIPEDGSLSATMFIEIPDMERIKTILDAFQGLDRPNTVFLKIGGGQSFAEFEEGHSKEDRISAVHYVRFRLSPEQVKNFRDQKVELHVNHPAYTAQTVLSDEQKREIASDLKD